MLVTKYTKRAPTRLSSRSRHQSFEIGRSSAKTSVAVSPSVGSDDIGVYASHRMVFHERAEFVSPFSGAESLTYVV